MGYSRYIVIPLAYLHLADIVNITANSW